MKKEILRKYFHGLTDKQFEEKVSRFPLNNVFGAMEEYAEAKAGQHETFVIGWIEIEGNKKLFEKHINDDMMLRFDNGDECRYADDWPFAVATHFQIKESQ